MLTHFIGGPKHGESIAVSSRHDIIQTVEAAHAIYRTNDDFLSPVGPSFTEHTYRVTRRTDRYAVAEWQPPSVDVSFAVRFKIDTFDYPTLEAVREFFWGRRGQDANSSRPGGVKCVAATQAHSEEFELCLQVRVDGPNDPIALSTAAEKVKVYLDANLPAKVAQYGIVSTSASVIS